MNLAVKGVWKIYNISKKIKLLSQYFFRKESLASPSIIQAKSLRNEIFDKKTYYNSHFRVRDLDSVIIDVGANIGLFTQWIATEYSPKTIFAFEASPVTYKYLVRNLKKLSRMNSSITFTPIHAVVSDVADQVVEIYHNPREIASSTVHEQGKCLGCKVYQVSTTTLSNQLTNHNIDFVDLLKIDVEGHFMEVLKGIDDKDYYKIQNIVIECDWIPEGATMYTDVKYFLQEKGYKTEVDNLSKSNNIIVYAYRE